MDETLHSGEDDEVMSVAVQTMMSLNVNYNQPINPFDLVGISVYRELQRRSSLLALEQAMTVDILMGMLSERIVNNTRNVLNDLDVAVDEELLRLLFEEPFVEEEVVPLKKPNLTNARAQSCSICFDEIVEGEPIYDIPCKHQFHSKCLEKWLDRRKDSCPLCRQKMV